MITKKKAPMVTLVALRRLAKKALGDDVKAVEVHGGDVWNVWTTGILGASISHTNRALARRALKAALEALVKG
jgi:hypothetical protein